MPCMPSKRSTGSVIGAVTTIAPKRSAAASAANLQLCFQYLWLPQPWISNHFRYEAYILNHVPIGIIFNSTKTMSWSSSLTQHFIKTCRLDTCVLLPIGHRLVSAVSPVSKIGPVRLWLVLFHIHRNCTFCTFLMRLILGIILVS